MVNPDLSPNTPRSRRWLLKSFVASATLTTASAIDLVRIEKRIDAFGERVNLPPRVSPERYYEAKLTKHELSQEPSLSEDERAELAYARSLLAQEQNRTEAIRSFIEETGLDTRIDRNFQTASLGTAAAFITGTSYFHAGGGRNIAKSIMRIPLIRSLVTSYMNTI